MRAELVAYGRSWERLGYDLKLWTETNLPPLANQQLYDDLEHLVVNAGGGDPALGLWVQRADLVSYELIFQLGGIYANTDMEAVRRIPLNGVKAFAGMEDTEFLSNALMGCEANHPFFGSVIDELPRRFHANPGAPMNGTTGPHLLTAMYRHDSSGLTVFPKEKFNPVLFGADSMNHEWDDFPDAYTVHHWGHTRGRWTSEPSDEFLTARFGSC